MRLPSSEILSRAAAPQLAAAALSALLLLPGPVPPALADGDTKEFKFPPIDRSNKDRCKWTSSAMGQASGARLAVRPARVR